MTDAPDDDEPLTLREACELIFRNTISPATLRAEAERGRLVIEKIGRKHFVTRAAIKEMRRLCQLGVPQEDRGLNPTQNASARGASPTLRSELSVTERAKLARDACLLTLEKLNGTSPATSSHGKRRRA